MSQSKIQAVYMRGGTSKGGFFRDDWLPVDVASRDRILMRVIGSPDPYGQQMDGMGGATSSTSKVVIVAERVSFASAPLVAPLEGIIGAECSIVDLARSVTALRAHGLLAGFRSLCRHSHFGVGKRQLSLHADT
ncbi:hypothetical protein QFZ98_000602 [Paraburkholderia youngii]